MLPSNSEFDRVFANSATSVTITRYRNRKDISNPTIDIVASRSPWPGGRPTAPTGRIGNRDVSVFQETSDGSPIGWTGFWDDPDGVRMIVQVYDLDRSVLESLIPTIKRADPKTARRLIAASDPAYQFQRGPASAARQIATGQSGSSNWKLIAYVPPNYPLGNIERRSLCWQFTTTRSTGHLACSRDLTWIRISPDTRIIAVIAVIAVIADSRSATAHQNLAIRLQAFRVNASRLATIDLPPVKTRPVAIPTLQSVALIANAPATACVAFLGDDNGPAGELFDRQDQSDPCTQEIAKATGASGTPLPATSAPHS